jgi:hypothetical protein
MSKAANIFLAMLFIFVVFTSCAGPKASNEEENVLNSLINIQTSLESDITYDELVALLSEAKPQVDKLKRSENSNRCFISAVDKCYASYEIARKAWKQKMEINNEQRRQDMEMTFSFSISLAALNIEKARNCYR